MVIIKGRLTSRQFYYWFSILCRQCSLSLSAPGVHCGLSCALDVLWLEWVPDEEKSSIWAQCKEEPSNGQHAPRWSSLPQEVVNLLSQKVLKHKMTFKAFPTWGLSDCMSQEWQSLLQSLDSQGFSCVWGLCTGPVPMGTTPNSSVGSTPSCHPQPLLLSVIGISAHRQRPDISWLLVREKWDKPEPVAGLSERRRWEEGPGGTFFLTLVLPSVWSPSYKSASGGLVCTLLFAPRGRKQFWGRSIDPKFLSFFNSPVGDSHYLSSTRYIINGLCFQQVKVIF